MIDHPSGERMDAYLDDELAPADRARVEAHIATCSPCAAELEALRALIADIGRLPAAIAPERDLLPGIHAAVEQGAVVPIHPGREATALRERSLRSVRGWLVAAAVVLVALSAGTTALLLRDRGVPVTAVDGAASSSRPEPTPGLVRMEGVEAKLVAATADLERAISEQREQLAPETVRVLEENLAIIDVALAESRRALRDDPGNRALSEILMAMYERKLDLLRSAAASVPS